MNEEKDFYLECTGDNERERMAITGGVDRLLMCKFCAKAYACNCTIECHSQTHEELLCRCHRCDKTASCTTSLEMHMGTSGEDVSYKEDVGDHGGEMSRHDTLFKCEYCSYKFARITRLRRHTRRYHPNENPCVWKKCDEAYRCPVSQTNHEKIHRLQCELCDKGFAHYCSLRKHILRMHSSMKKSVNGVPRGKAFKIVAKDKPYKCQFCCATSRSARGLKMHTKASHPSENAFQCEFCVTTFASYKRFRSHVVTHTEGRRWECNVCSKRLTTTCNLKQHLLLHIGYKPYACKFCPKTFLARGALTYHERTHTGEKPFKCHLCQNAYARSYRLKLHIRTHTGQKQYNCQLCEKPYQSSNGLYKHRMTHTECKSKTLSNDHVNSREKQTTTMMCHRSLPLNAVHVGTCRPAQKSINNSFWDLNHS